VKSAIQKEINFNKEAHNKIANLYEKKHTEIYNGVEQARLKVALRESFASIESVTQKPLALDVGCGAGNLTKHLVDLGAMVTSADVSKGFLAIVEDRFRSVKTHELNGDDLKEFPDASFDIVVTYSVLHHVPDYLKMVEEMCRVLKPGGVLYIDHEKNDFFWTNNEVLLEYYKKRHHVPPVSKFFQRVRNFINPEYYVSKYLKYVNPRYQVEGDIHVWPDDHIEWQKIKVIIEKNKLEIIKQYDFLLFNSKFDATLYNQYKEKITDTRAVIFRKSI